MKTSVIGFPRIGLHRELKFALESFFRGETSPQDLLSTGHALRERHWLQQQASGIDLIPVGDFSLYDNMLDTACLLGAVPSRYRALDLSPLDTYFAMARGYQRANGDVRALSMKKWFDTNYHYLVPELEDTTCFHLHADRLKQEITEAALLRLKSKAVVIGPYTFLRLAHYTGTKTIRDFARTIIPVYQELLAELGQTSLEWLALDEPILATDSTPEELAVFREIYQALLQEKHGLKILCQTYFGDVRDSYDILTSQLSFDGLGLDFVAGKQNLALLQEKGIPGNITLFAGVINGRNIWRNHYRKTLDLIHDLQRHTDQLVLSTSCSLLHVPMSLETETTLASGILKHFAFANEKLQELNDLKRLTALYDPDHEQLLQQNDALFNGTRYQANPAVQQKIASLTSINFKRMPRRAVRERIQRELFQLPVLPTTTIGSFPQTAEVRKNRADYKHKRITPKQYIRQNKQFIADCIQLQEKLGLDVLVHGEFERNDMVEYFGEHLDGCLFTSNGWVQSYGSRCVKPPVIWGDISRRSPITVKWSVYAQSLTQRFVKGMLTGPVTILNWSFPREDISLKESAFQIALAIREEVLDLEQHGIRIIQIDEAALREKLPLHHADWYPEYLDWAIAAFRLASSGVRPETQIHTHMCYSEFQDIIYDIDAMDADVITFESARSDLSLIDTLRAVNFQTQTGPGIYDIHSPRIPSSKEIEHSILRILDKLPLNKVWVNPDCGLKTRRNDEATPSLKHMITAVKHLRQKLAEAAQ
ncbi:MAG: 5-methyltetrahydropteroyltriglutamate--homocysteine S-methyltransferase [Selenomonas sp.]|jgi:5-methyltetrahydropteroyltriglutamate--homocysteine methyltransferase|nr:5-methyltetrahydropteroyltriglutamate--homocysteine S-methyltransferase [Selenomonas sp.]